MILKNIKIKKTLLLESSWPNCKFDPEQFFLRIELTRLASRYRVDEWQLNLYTSSVFLHGCRVPWATAKLGLQPDPLGAVDEAERDERLGLVVSELVRPRHPAGVARARARALVLPVEHRPASTVQHRARRR